MRIYQFKVLSKNHGFSRFPKVSCEIWVSLSFTPPSYVQAEKSALLELHEEFKVVDVRAPRLLVQHPGRRFAESMRFVVSYTLPPSDTLYNQKRASEPCGSFWCV